MKAISAAPPGSAAREMFMPAEEVIPPASPPPARREELLATLATRSQMLSLEGYRQLMDSMAQIGLTAPQASVLMLISRVAGRAKMSDLARQIQASAGNLTGIVDRLTAAGLVARERDAADRRAVYVSLTEAGRRKVEEIAAQRKAKMVEMMANFSDDEVAQFNDFLRRFLRALGASGDIP
jgi:DNA-binding MarR family transcriptional regulator